MRTHIVDDVVNVVTDIVNDMEKCAWKPKETHTVSTGGGGFLDA